MKKNMRKVVLIPVSNNRVEDLKFTLWSLSHTNDIYVCIIAHKLNSINKKKLLSSYLKNKFK